MVLEGKELVRQRESLLAQTDALIVGTEEEKRLTLAAIAKAEEEKLRRIDDPEAWAQADATVARQRRELDRLEGLLEKRRRDRAALVPKLSQARAEEAKAELASACGTLSRRLEDLMRALPKADEAAATVLSCRHAVDAAWARAVEICSAADVELEWPLQADEADFRARAQSLGPLLASGPRTPRADEEATRARGAAESRRRDEEMLRSVERQFPSALLQLPERLREEGARRQEARRSVRS
jgi:hypothetical protein